MKLTKTLTFAGVQFKGDANGLIELASAIKKSANQVQHAINWAVHSALILTEDPKCQRVPIESLLNALVDSYPTQGRKLIAFIKSEVPYLEVVRLPKDEATAYAVVFNKQLKECDRYLNSELPSFSSWEVKGPGAFPAKVSPKRVESLISGFQKRVQAASLLDPESKGKLDLEAEKSELIAALMDAYQTLTGGKVATTGLVEELDAIKLTVAEEGAESLKATAKAKAKAPTKSLDQAKAPAKVA